MSQIDSTLKSTEVEETIDLYFFRPLGYVFARLCQKLGVTPNSVTVTSIILGVVAGHLFYYQDFVVNIIGIGLFLLADILDSTDGQLARMNGASSKFGRILDGVAGNTIFFSIYVHFCFRLLDQGFSVMVFPFALIVGISHSFQSGMSDFYRNVYMWLVQNKGDVEKSAKVRSEFRSYRWLSRGLGKKLLLLVYLNYTNQQELLSKNFQRLREAIARVYGNRIPASFSELYRAKNKPMMRLYSTLSTNLRISVMFVLILINEVIYYYWFVFIVLNLSLAITMFLQERINKGLTVWVEAHPEAT